MENHQKYYVAGTGRGASFRLRKITGKHRAVLTLSNVGYRAWSRKDIGDETLRLSPALSTASRQQENARTNDTIGVLLIGRPVSSMSGGNIAPEAARIKGEIEAVHQASIGKKCGRRFGRQVINPFISHSIFCLTA